MSDHLRIRLAVPVDADAIAVLSRTEIEYGLPWRWTPPRVQRAIRDPATNVVVASQGGPLVAFGIMYYRDTVAHLNLLAVRPDARRQGIGGAVLTWLENVASVAGISSVRLEARQDNVAARAFYRKHGYCERASVLGMYLGMEDGVRLEKVLTRAREGLRGT